MDRLGSQAASALPDAIYDALSKFLAQTCRVVTSRGNYLIDRDRAKPSDFRLNDRSGSGALAIDQRG